MIRSLIGRDRSPTLVLDIGTIRTNIMIVENGIPFVSRSVAQGGLNVTKEMSTALNMTEDQAESMKIDASSMSSLYGEGFPKLFEKALAPILTELTYSTNLFLGQKANENKRLDKIILTGGGALLPQLSEYISKATSLRVYVGDPWARVVYPEALRPVLNQIGPRFGVAVGLAMRDID
jgi:type IV pilus assembly protein PilM